MENNRIRKQKKFTVPEKVPGWLCEIKRDSLLNSKDLAGIFSSSDRNITLKIAPDIRRERVACPYRKMNKWKVGTIIDFINNHNNKSLGKQ